MSQIRIAGRIAAVTLLLFAGAARAADERTWTVSKSSGEVWTVTGGAQPVSLSQQADLQPGDTIRTGRNGRVLLVRGEESILIAPNSAIGIPKKSADGLSTTIMQQAGSILLEVEKRNVQHFEVETPYLAAVVKGTQFRVSVGANSTSVNVLRGQVQVADFKSGQIAQIMPGQSATSFAQGKIGLALSGSGSFNPIEQGKPRAPSIERLMVPKNGLTAPRNAAAGTQVRTVGQITPATVARTAVAAKPAAVPSVTPARLAGGIRIAVPIGEVRLNFSKVTNGLARGTTAPSPGRAVASRDSTIWTPRDGKPSSAVAQGNSSDPTSPNDSSNVAAASPGVAAAATPAAAVVSSNSASAAFSGASMGSNSSSSSTGATSSSSSPSASGLTGLNSSSSSSGLTGSNSTSGSSGSTGSNSSSGSSGSTSSNSGSSGGTSSSNSGSSNNGRGNGASGNGNGSRVGDNSGRGNGNGNNGDGNGNGNNGNGNGKSNGGGSGNGNNGNGNGNSGNDNGNGNNGNGNGRNR